MKKLLLPIVAGLIGLAFAYAVFVSNSPKPTTPNNTTGQAAETATADGERPDVEVADDVAVTTDDAGDAPVAATDDAGDAGDAGDADEPADTIAVSDEPDNDEPDLAAEQATPVAGAALDLTVSGAEVAEDSVVGSLADGNEYRIQAEIVATGAGVKYIHLKDWFETSHPVPHPMVPGSPPAQNAKGREASTDDTTRFHYTLQSRVPVLMKGKQVWLYPFSARAVRVTEIIDGLPAKTLAFDLQNVKWHKAESDATSPTYRVDLVDPSGNSVLRFVRTFHLREGETAYDIELEQRVENLSQRTFKVKWEQNAIADMPKQSGSRFLERKIAVAYIDPTRTTRYIRTTDTYEDRGAIVKDMGEEPRKLPTGETISYGIQALGEMWPPEKDPKDLVWVSMVNRFFATFVHAPVDAKGKPGELGSTWAVLGAQYIPVWFDDTEPAHLRDPRAEQPAMVMTLTSKTLDVAPGQTQHFDIDIYAGPRDPDVFEQPPYSDLYFKLTVIYELGCTLCTFQPLAHLLLGFLQLCHTFTQDWAVSLIVLVLIVRLCLHPITKKAQTNMMVFQKQVQKLQPELDKIKKKYPDDNQKQQQEQLRLWREHGINPLKMLGCLPMFLQMPIWVALYATLWLAIDLYQQPAFYGFFQLFGDWGFLRDLSQPDAFIRFYPEPRVVRILIFQIDYSTFNILPILWAIVMYGNQKLMTPPATTDQQKQQQTMMKFMTLIWPFMLYSSPSALTLYFLASTGAGMLDSYLVRKHIREAEERGELLTEKKKDGDEKPGWLGRIIAAAHAKQAELEKMQQEAEIQKRRGGGKPSGKGGRKGR